jgi:hypothetical protein
VLGEMEDMTKGRCRSLTSETASFVDMMTVKGAKKRKGCVWCEVARCHTTRKRKKQSGFHSPRDSVLPVIGKLDSRPGTARSYFHMYTRSPRHVLPLATGRQFIGASFES